MQAVWLTAKCGQAVARQAGLWANLQGAGVVLEYGLRTMVAWRIIRAARILQVTVKENI